MVVVKPRAKCSDIKTWAVLVPGEKGSSSLMVRIPLVLLGIELWVRWLLLYYHSIRRPCHPITKLLLPYPWVLLYQVTTVGKHEVFVVRAICFSTASRTVWFHVLDECLHILDRTHLSSRRVLLQWHFPIYRSIHRSCHSVIFVPQHHFP